MSCLVLSEERLFSIPVSVVVEKITYTQLRLLSPGSATYSWFLERSSVNFVCCLREREKVGGRKRVCKR